MKVYSFVFVVRFDRKIKSCFKMSFLSLQILTRSSNKSKHIWTNNALKWKIEPAK